MLTVLPTAKLCRTAVARAGVNYAGVAMLLLTNCMSGTCCIAAQSLQMQRVDWQTSPLDLDLRGMNGERYTFVCPPGKPAPSRVIGSGPYTDDSSICTAAVHAGALSAKAGGVVTIEIRPGQTTYPGSEQSYITSASYDRPWSGSFVVVKDDLPVSPAPTN